METLSKTCESQNRRIVPQRGRHFGRLWSRCFGATFIFWPYDVFRVTKVPNGLGDNREVWPFTSGRRRKSRRRPLTLLPWLAGRESLLGLPCCKEGEIVDKTPNFVL